MDDLNIYKISVQLGIDGHMYIQASSVEEAMQIAEDIVNPDNVISDKSELIHMEFEEISDPIEVFIDNAKYQLHSVADSHEIDISDLDTIIEDFASKAKRILRMPTPSGQMHCES